MFGCASESQDYFTQEQIYNRHDLKGGIVIRNPVIHGPYQAGLGITESEGRSLSGSFTKNGATVMVEVPGEPGFALVAVPVYNEKGEMDYFVQKIRAE